MVIFQHSYVIVIVYGTLGSGNADPWRGGGDVSIYACFYCGQVS